MNDTSEKETYMSPSKTKNESKQNIRRLRKLEELKRRLQELCIGVVLVFISVLILLILLNSHLNTVYVVIILIFDFDCLVLGSILIGDAIRN